MASSRPLDTGSIAIDATHDTTSMLSGDGRSTAPWIRSVAAWSQCEIAAPSLSFRHTYGVSFLGPGPGRAPMFQICQFDGQSPAAVLDTRRQELAYLTQTEDKAPARGSIFGSSKSAAQASVPTDVRPSPVAMVYAVSPDDGTERLVVLLLTGHLLIVHPVSLSVVDVIGILPPVIPQNSSGKPLAALPRWVIVAMGPRLGVAPLFEEQHGHRGGRDAKPVELPKGTTAAAVLAYPTSDDLLLVGCSTGQILVYASSVVESKDVKKFSQLALTLLTSFDVATAPRASITKSGSGFMGRNRSASRTPSGAFGVSDISALTPPAEAQQGFFVACGAGLQRPGGVVSVWHLPFAGLRAALGSRRSTGDGQFCKLATSGSTGTALLRALPVPSSQAGGLATFAVVSLDVAGAVALWESTGGIGGLRCLQTFAYGVSPDINRYPSAAARTFAWVGSVYLVLGSGAREAAWLDVLSLLTHCLAPPLHSCSRTSLSPLLGPLVVPAADQQVEIAHGGEVFFTSEGCVRCYNAATGNTVGLPIKRPAGEEADFTVRRVLGAIHQSPAGKASHLLLSMALKSRQAPEAQAAVWVVSTAGTLEQQIPGAFDAALIGHAAESTIVWLGNGGTDGRVLVGSAPSFGGPPRTVTQVVGYQRVLRTPLAGGRMAMYWGSQLPQSPLRLSRSSSGANDGGPNDVCPLPLPESSGAELVAAEWDLRQGHSERGPWAVALASAHHIWVGRFTSSTSGTLIAWLDVRQTFSGLMRTLDLSWWRPTSQTTRLNGPLLISTISGVISWQPGVTSHAQVVAISDKPLLLAGVLLDRLLCVEVEVKASAFGIIGRPRGPRARVRTRPVNLISTAAPCGSHGVGEAECDAAVHPVRNSDWRIVPLVLPHGLPVPVKQALWQSAISPEAPPQLCLSTPSFHRLAVASNDEFRALASLVIKLQSALALRRKGAASEMDDEFQAAEQVEESVRMVRSHPAWVDFAHSASRLLLRCAAQARSLTAASGLVVVSRGLARHDLLPMATAVAKLIRGLRHGEQPLSAWQCINSDSAGMLQQHEGDATRIMAHWTSSLLSPAPLAVALLHEVGMRKTRASGGPGFSAADLLSQRRSEAPSQYRPAQLVQPGNHGVCALHTATVAQWLGIGTTKAQVKLMQSMLQRDVHAPEAQATDRADAPAAVAPLRVRASGLLAYWRCADGQGKSLRDSGGCGRVAILQGACDWVGPLSPYDPMEFTDEWDEKLAPNFAVALGTNGMVVYSLRKGGEEETTDKEMLSLVGGSARPGERHLREAKAIDGVDQSEGHTPGWTVELWLRLPDQSAGEVCIFSRANAPGDDARSAALSWTLASETSMMLVRVGGQQVLAGAVPELQRATWQHLALRSDANQLTLWLNSHIVLSSSRGVAIPKVPDSTNIRFGPIPDAEVTEIRVWGYCRGDDDLQEGKHQPLQTIADHERKADKWKKVKVRDTAVVDEMDQDTLAGLGTLFGLGGVPATQGSRRKGNQAPKESLVEEDDFHELHFDDADYDDVDLEDFTDELFNALRIVGLSEDHLSKLAINLRAGSIVAEVRGPGASIKELRNLPLHDLNVMGFKARHMSLPSAAHVDHGHSHPEPDGFGDWGGFGSADGHAFDFGHDWPVHDDPFSKTGFDDRADDGWPGHDADAFGSTFHQPGHDHHHGGLDDGASDGSRKPASFDLDGPALGRRQSLESQSRRESLASLPRRLSLESQSRRGSMEFPPQHHLDSARRQSVDSYGSQRSDLGHQKKVPGSAVASSAGDFDAPAMSPRSPRTKTATHPPLPSKTQRHSRPQQSSIQPGTMLKQRPATPFERGEALTRALPAPTGSDGAAAAAADEDFKVASVALEGKSYGMAAASFRGASELIQKYIQQLNRQGIGPGNVPQRISPVLKARLQAATSYGTLCALLRRCDELRQQVSAKAPGTEPQALQALCSAWACALRLPKSPRHGALVGVQAMATYFVHAQHIGGWVVAERLATMLLQPQNREFLLQKEVEQVQYVRQAAAVGAVAVGMPPTVAGICGRCSRCGESLEPLLKTCKACHLPVVVCYRDLRVCDIRETARCDVCGAIVSHDATNQRRWKPGGVGQVLPRTSHCIFCKMGMMHDWRPSDDQEVLPY